MRVLVLDPSGILPWRIRHALGETHEVIATGCLEEAERLTRSRRPEAVVVSVAHASQPWGSFHETCAASHPPIPVLYESCLPGGLAALGVVHGESSGNGAALLAKPASQPELLNALERLLGEVRRIRGTVAPAIAREIDR